MATAELILGILLKYGPAAAQLAQSILTKPDPKQSDWDALFSLAEKPYQYTFPITAGPIVVPPGAVPPTGPPTCPAGTHWQAVQGAPGGGFCVPD